MKKKTRARRRVSRAKSRPPHLAARRDPKPPRPAFAHAPGTIVLYTDGSAYQADDRGSLHKLPPLRAAAAHELRRRRDLAAAELRAANEAAAKVATESRAGTAAPSPASPAGQNECGTTPDGAEAGASPIAMAEPEPEPTGIARLGWLLRRRARRAAQV